MIAGRRRIGTPPGDPTVGGVEDGIVWDDSAEYRPPTLAIVCSQLGLDIARHIAFAAATATDDGRIRG